MPIRHVIRLGTFRRLAIISHVSHQCSWFSLNISASDTLFPLRIICEGASMCIRTLSVCPNLPGIFIVIITLHWWCSSYRNACVPSKNDRQTNPDGKGMERERGRKRRAYVTLLMEGVYLQFHVCDAFKSRVVFSDGQYRHSVVCLWPSALGVWRLSESLEVESGTDLGWVWEEGGKEPRLLCVRRGGPPRLGGQCVGAVGVC